MSCVARIWGTAVYSAFVLLRASSVGTSLFTADLLANFLLLPNLICAGFLGGRDRWYVLDDDGSLATVNSELGGHLFCVQNGAACGVNSARAGVYHLLQWLLDPAQLQAAIQHYSESDRNALLTASADDMQLGLLLGVYQVIRHLMDPRWWVHLSLLLGGFSSKCWLSLFVCISLCLVAR